MKPDFRSEQSPNPENQSELLSSADDRRVQARRRFLRMGAGGSAALVVTVVHKRAFAGPKKNVVASNCASLRGVPDLKHADKKKALETSAMGTPKGLICRPRDEPHPLPPAAGRKKSQFYKFPNDSGQQYYISAKQFDDGLGSIEKTVEASYNYRLYEKGYCPLKYDGRNLTYDRSATYFEKKKGSTFELKSCKAP
jgi:hypothetical protein